MLLLTLTRIFVLLVPICARTDFVSDLKRFRRQNNNVDNAIIEIYNDCKCVYYYQCDENNFVITNGIGLISERSKTPRIPCKGSFENEIVCCKLRNNSVPLQPDLKSNDYQVVEVVDEDNNVNETESPKQLNCGTHKTVISVRIFNGEDELTPITGEFPWIAAIFRKSSDEYKFHCSGSLIHPKVVLTANHCVHQKGAGAFKVIVNGQVTLTGIGNKTTEERGVSEIIHHPDYYPGALFNDVALLILDEPYSTTKKNFINTLCLPPSTVSLDNTKCLVAGWGKDASGKHQEIMKKIELPFVEFNRCQDLLRMTRLQSSFTLHKSFMCAGGEKGKDACKGDGGSPLMCPFQNETRYFQIGIVSWGVGCGEENVPGVYANVQQFADWIRNELRNRQLAI